MLPIGCHDLTAERKTAINYLKITRELIAHLTIVLGLVVIGWCTDAGGEARAMRRRLVSIMPHLIVLDCWAHQVCEVESNDDYDIE